MDRPWAHVPGWVGPALAPDLLAAADSIIAAVRAQVPEYARPLEGRFGERITRGVTVALRQFVALLGSEADLPDTRVYHDLGLVEHREGRTLAALQAAYQVGSRSVWQAITRGETARRLEPDDVFALAEALFGFIEQLSAASVVGWAHAEATVAGSLRARRQELVELLLRTPPPTTAELDRAAAAAGWTLPTSIVPVVVDDAVEIAGRLPGAVGARIEPLGVVLHGDRDDLADVVRRAVRGRRAVLGPAVAPGDVARSVARARAAWPLHVAGTLGDRPVVRADDHLVTLLLAADAGLTTDLCDRALAPLRALPAGAGSRAEETLRAWLDAHGDVTATAASLHVHPQTVRYRLAGLRDVFGDALDDPIRRLELTLALRACEGGGR
ncbi:helix-turn-helix domain-containing protein [Pseudonocardia sp. N23]|uniref:helix-turn-helix domain-containing protein n=1 Tax=Pseudonocardia sp. N23 TaxID=1987376 RepID=UPI000BFD27B5|nr:helix-turn-helix domain-containing protein [Pseudonocardia sp. N23]GAY12296.1 transcriptional regulator, CdaR [Pseudonocardia sp. N23]